MKYASGVWFRAACRGFGIAARPRTKPGTWGFVAMLGTLPTAVWRCSPAAHRRRSKRWWHGWPRARPWPGCPRSNVSRYRRSPAKMWRGSGRAEPWRWAGDALVIVIPVDGGRHDHGHANAVTAHHHHCGPPDRGPWRPGRGCICRLADRCGRPSMPGARSIGPRTPTSTDRCMPRVGPRWAARSTLAQGNPIEHYRVETLIASSSQK